MTVDEGLQPGEVVYRKRCRSHRCKLEDHVTFHEFDPATYDPERVRDTVRTYHIPYRDPHELADRLKELGSNGHKLR